jgi:hypothetical protein
MPMRRGGKKNVAKNRKKNQKQQEVRHLGLKQKRQKTKKNPLTPHQPFKKKPKSKTKTTIRSNEHPTRRESCK